MDAALSESFIVVKTSSEMPDSHICSESESQLFESQGNYAKLCVYVDEQAPWRLLADHSRSSDHRAHVLGLKRHRRVSQTHQVNHVTLSKHHLPSEKAGLTYHNHRTLPLPRTTGPRSSWVVSGLSCIITVPRCSKKTLEYSENASFQPGRNCLITSMGLIRRAAVRLGGSKWNEMFARWRRKTPQTTFLRLQWFHWYEYQIPRVCFLSIFVFCRGLVHER